MVNLKLERRLRDGRSDTINLPYEKTRIEGDIGYLERVKAGMNQDVRGLEGINLKLKYLMRLNEMLNEAIRRQREKNTRTMTVSNG